MFISTSTSTSPSAAALRGIHRLATVHAHAWAYECSEDELVENQVLAFEKATEAMEASEHRPIGLRPSLSHVTGTGRLSWSPSWDGQGIRLEVSRPAGGVVSGQGGYTVAVGRVNWDQDGKLDVSVLVDARPGVGVQLRHLSVLEEAVAAAIGSYETPIEAEGWALERVRMHAEGSWFDDEYFGGSAAELVVRLDVESAALDAARALALATGCYPSRGRPSYQDPTPEAALDAEPDAALVP